MKRWAALILVLVMVLGMTGCGSVNLSEDEQWAVDACISLKEPLAEPEAFRLYSDPFIIQRYKEVPDGDDELDSEYLLIEYGAKNAYNAMVRKQAIFDRDGYLCDYEDKDEVDLSERGVKIFAMNMTLLLYESFQGGKTNGEVYFNTITLSQEKIEAAIK